MKVRFYLIIQIQRLHKWGYMSYRVEDGHISKRDARVIIDTIFQLTFQIITFCIKT